MEYINVLEKLSLTEKIKELSFLEKEFNYHKNYEELNLAIISKAKEGEKSISFDFVDNDMTNFKKETISKVEFEYRRIYPPYKGGYALMNTYNYPRYLSARGFKIEIKENQKNHGYISKSYYISWENYRLT